MEHFVKLRCKIKSTSKNSYLNIWMLKFSYVSLLQTTWATGSFTTSNGKVKLDILIEAPLSWGYCFMST